MAADALIASRMNMNPGGKQPTMRNGWYVNEYGNKIEQSMIFPDNHQLKRQPKGIKQVLKERNLWPIKSICLMCEQYFSKYDEVNPERLDYYA